MPKLVLYVAIHGILTGRSNPTWPERFEIWAASRVCNLSVLTDHYRAGPFPWWNVWVQNPQAAKAVDSVVENWLDGREPGEVDVHFVGHSNGCDIARRAAIRLLRRGYPIKSLLLFSAPTEPSIERMGLKSFIDDGTLSRVVVYAADDDQVLSPPRNWKQPWTMIRSALRWPYGNAGRVGLRDGEQTVIRYDPHIHARTATRLFPGWGHGDFFPLTNPGRMVRTFETIARDSRVYCKTP